MESLNLIDWLSSLLAFAGGGNLALIGFFNYDLLAKLFGNNVGYRSVVATIAVSLLYIVSAVWVRINSRRSDHAGSFREGNYHGIHESY